MPPGVCQKAISYHSLGGCVINLLDTPGHKDFSEDTYRVLTAVDSVIMVIDAAKEPFAERNGSV